MVVKLVTRVLPLGLRNHRLTFSVFRRLHNEALENEPLTQSSTSTENSTSIEEEFLATFPKIGNIIIYNSVLHGDFYSPKIERTTIRSEICERKKKWNVAQMKDEPVSLHIPSLLKELGESQTVFDKVSDEMDDQSVPIEEQKNVQFPYGKRNVRDKFDIKKTISSKSWMADYEFFNDSILEMEKANYLENPDEEDELMDKKSADTYYNSEWKLNYGTSDPAARPSAVPCSGCGARLHCNDTGIPGYLPSEIFKGLSNEQLMTIICQRCHFLKKYNIALNLTVDPNEYPEMLSKIREEKALIILMIDLLDFPCSIWPNITDVIGSRQQIIVAANKVDLLPQDSRGYLDHIKTCVKDTLLKSSLKNARIRDIALISAKTGYGIEELITKMHNIWKHRGNVYLVGCTNVGKSSLFNALLQSDYCRVTDPDLLKRATVSSWPGTTLNLMKFPILRPAGWRLHLRNRRLIALARVEKQEKQVRIAQLRNERSAKYATLIGHIDSTFRYDEDKTYIDGDPFSYSLRSGFTEDFNRVGIGAHNEKFKESKWCYDTPGVMNPDQILSLLTLDELMITLPKGLIRSRTFLLFENKSLFIGGLARLDVLKCERPVLLTVFAAPLLPITICRTRNADGIYSQLLGSKLFAVPFGNLDRLKSWPGLETNGEQICLTCSSYKRSDHDIILSSAGWIAISGYPNCEYRFQAWTPNAKGIYLRTPALLQYSVNLRGNRILSGDRSTPAYNRGRLYIDPLK